MSNQATIAQAARQFMQVIKSLGTESAAMPKVADSFLNQLAQATGKDGTDALAELLLQDFQRVRGSGLTEEQATVFEYKDAVIQKYHQMIQSMLQHNDSRKTLDASGLTDEDLIATIGGLIPELIQAPEFRAKIVHEAIKADPDLRRQIVELGGVTVVDAKPLPPVIEDELDYSEAGDTSED